MSHSRLTVFISSTCYDLAQIRDDVKLFCENSEIDVLISEKDSFPVNPEISAIENCLNNVKAHTDIFVLIIGNRYGTLGETGKSITNLEYLEAKATGMPKYVFVKREILTLLRVWQNDKSVNLSCIIDSPDLLVFISEIYNSGDVWVFPFDYASDVIKTLKSQFSYLFLDSLKWRKLLQPKERLIERLDPLSLKHFSEKTPGWEFLCLSSLIRHRIMCLQGKRFDLELGISLGESVQLSSYDDVANWISKKTGDASILLGAISPLLKGGVIKAIGEPGVPGNIELIEHVATRLAEIYSAVLDWSLEFHRVSSNAKFEHAIKLTQNLLNDAIAEIYDYSISMYDRVVDYLRNHSTGDVLELTLLLKSVNTDDLLAELANLQNHG